MANLTPIIVVGTGRCGTSTIARLLHTKFNICMGERFREPDEHNPDGYFEDLDFRDANEAMLCGKLSAVQWYFRISQIVSLRKQSKIQWGAKDPRFCDTAEMFQGWFENANVIVCTRDDDLVMQSMQRCYDWFESRSAAFIKGRKAGINVWKRRNHVEIHFCKEHISDEDLVEKLRPFLLEHRYIGQKKGKK